MKQNWGNGDNFCGKVKVLYDNIAASIIYFPSGRSSRDKNITERHDHQRKNRSDDVCDRRGERIISHREEVFDRA